jgi:hypothetical protein
MTGMVFQAWSSLTIMTIAAGGFDADGDAPGEGGPFRLATAMAAPATTARTTATPIRSLGRPPSLRGTPSLPPDR